MLRKGAPEYQPTSKVRQIRHDQFLTMEELAEKAGVHFQTVVRVEHGQPAKASTIKKIAAALGVEPKDIVQR